MTKNYDNLFDACYSIRYSHAGDSVTDDDQYIEHVFNKIPDEEYKILDGATSNAAKAIMEIIKNGIDSAMNKYN